MIPPSSSLLHTTAKLNNKATTYMQNGDYQKAIVILSQAVFSLKRRQPANTTAAEQESSTTANNDDRLPPFEFVSTKRPLSEGASCSTATTKNDDDFSSSCCSSSSWYLYDDAIRVIANEALALEEVTEVLSYAVFYNLGLCHHLQALTTTTSTTPDELLERSVVFYNHAQQLLNDHGDDLFLDGGMIQSLAITNNLGHVHHCLNHEPTAKICFERLLNAIMYLSSDSTTSEMSRQVMAKHDLCFEGFLTNVLNRLVSSSLPAAAA